METGTLGLGREAQLRRRRMLVADVVGALAGAVVAVVLIALLLA